ncbi:hypothetical protein ACFQHO_33720 [Actinomadura yumaensis]
MIAGFEEPTAGVVRLLGRDVTGSRPTGATSTWCSSRTRCSRT